MNALAKMAEIAAQECRAMHDHWNGGGKVEKALTAMALFLSEDERLKMVDIVDEVSSSSGISVADIMGRCRVADIAKARQVAMWLSYGEGISCSGIGRFFERDHTTVMHNVKTVTEVMGPPR